MIDSYGEKIHTPAARAIRPGSIKFMKTAKINIHDRKGEKRDGKCDDREYHDLSSLPADQQDPQYNQPRPHQLLRENSISEDKMCLQNGRYRPNTGDNRRIIGADPFHTRGQHKRRYHCGEHGQ